MQLLGKDCTIIREEPHAYLALLHMPLLQLSPPLPPISTLLASLCSTTAAYPLRSDREALSGIEKGQHLPQPGESHQQWKKEDSDGQLGAGGGAAGGGRDKMQCTQKVEMGRGGNRSVRLRNRGASVVRIAGGIPSTHIFLM